MTDFVIPLPNNNANISLNVTLSQQTCVINLYQKSTGLFFDLIVNNNPLVTARLCLNQTKLITESYLKFVGQLFFVDTKGNTDPVYTGFGDRYVLIYRDTNV